jgi:hypothetical protein
MWQKIQLVFPAIFIVIIVCQIYNHLSAPKPRFVTSEPYLPGEPRRAFQDSRAVVETAVDDEVRIQGEFRKLCKILVDRASKDNRAPPGNLAEALAVAQVDWPYGKETFQSVFRYLLDPTFAGKDPWGQPYLYRVDTKTATVSLRSFGPNGQEESDGGDDVEVSMKYGGHDKTLADDDGIAEEDVEEYSTSRMPMILILSSVALAAGYFSFRRMWGSSNG